MKSRLLILVLLLAAIGSSSAGQERQNPPAQAQAAKDDSAAQAKEAQAKDHLARGTALFEQSKWDEAIAEYREALRLKPDDAVAHRNLGAALYGKGDLDGAIAEYREALRLQPNYAQAHANLGVALKAKSDRGGAVAEKTGTSPAPEGTPGYFSNARVGVKILLPPEWRQVSEQAPSFGKPALVILNKPGTLAQVALAREVLEASPDLYLKLYDKQTTEQTELYQKTAEEKVKRDGLEGTKILSVFRQHDIRWRLWVEIFSRGNEHFRVVAYAPEEVYDRYLDTFKAMMSSVQFVGGKEELLAAPGGAAPQLPTVESKGPELQNAPSSVQPETPGHIGGVIGGALSSVPLPPNAARPKRIRVGGQVEASRQIFAPKPEYPPLAKMARIKGTVRLEAVISKDGTIQELKPISGHPLLLMAALEAVSRWRYQPTLLNGEPVEVATEIDVNFSLGSNQAAPPAADTARAPEPNKPAMAKPGEFVKGAYTVGGNVSAPVPIYKPDPPYSEQARKAKVQGTVTLSIVVDAQGNVSEIHDIRYLGYGLDENAIETVGTWKFRPAMREGVPAAARVAVEVLFRLDGGPGKAEEPATPAPSAPKKEEDLQLTVVPPPPEGRKESQPGPRLSPPGEEIRRAVQAAARGRASGSIPGPGDSTGQFQNLNPNFSNEGPEILSDTQGVEFGPYLATIVYIVRENWYHVIPEAARSGGKGRVDFVFKILKDGSVPEIHLLRSSGLDSLDRAAEAGIHASIPFPPLPIEFTGNHLVLHFKFLYNLGATQAQQNALATPSSAPSSGGGIGMGAGSATGPAKSGEVAPDKAAGITGVVYNVGGNVSAPVPTYKPQPPYSEEARRDKLEGTVLLGVVVDAQGNVSDVRVLKPLGKGLDEKAIGTVRTWKFRPGMRDGVPVPVRVAIEVAFKLY